MSTVEKTALGALIAPRSIEEFHGEFWPDKAPYFLVEGDPDRLPSFLRANELQSAEALARVNKGGVWQSNGMKSSYMMPVDKRAAEFVYKMGLTLYFEDIGQAVPGAGAFARQLEKDLGLNQGSARVTAWVSPGENGAACHYDAHDIISIQLRGTKRFDLAPVEGLVNPYGRQYSSGVTRPNDEAYPQMTHGFPAWREGDFESVLLNPGSVLAFHRGTWHRTFASEDSLAVAFVIEPPSAADCLLRQLRNVLLQDPRWRRPLYGAWGEGATYEAAVREAEALLKTLPKLAEVITPRDMTLALMPEEERLAAIDRTSRFQRTPNVTVSTEPPPEGTPAPGPGVRIVYRHEDGGEETLATLRIPRRGLDVLEWIVQTERPFTVEALAAEFPDVPFDGLKQLLQSAAKGNLVRLLWFPSINGATGGS